ncbi:MAG: HAD-IB family phosphatase [Thermoplasmata archaeon]
MELRDVEQPTEIAGVRWDGGVMETERARGQVREQNRARGATPRPACRSRPQGIGQPRLAILCDFDGTVTVEEVSVSILERFSGGRWRSADRALREGRITLRETMEREFSQVRATPGEIGRFVRGIHLRPGFGELLEWARAEGAPVVIVSEGLDFYIRSFLRERGLRVPFMANRAVFTKIGIRVQHPHASPLCGLCGNCKRAHIEAFRRGGFRTVFIGDGISDRCAAQHADVVFARGNLLRHCRSSGIGCVPYDDFFDVLWALRRITARGRKEAAAAERTKTKRSGRDRE